MKEKSSLAETTPMSESKRKRGRPPIEYYKNVNQILKAYKVHKTLVGAARALCIDVKTLKRVLQENGVEINKPSFTDIQKYGAMSRREGCFAQWLRLYKGTKLPRNMREIAEITGCTYDSVKSYLRYRKERIKEVLRGLPDIREMDVNLVDTLGYYVSSKEIKSYEYHIDKYSCDVVMMITMFDGTVTSAHINNIHGFQKEIEKVLQ
jgi:hypothetical protein